MNRLQTLITGLSQACSSTKRNCRKRAVPGGAVKVSVAAIEGRGRSHTCPAHGYLLLLMQVAYQRPRQRLPVACAVPLQR